MLHSHYSRFCWGRDVIMYEQEMSWLHYAVANAIALEARCKWKWYNGECKLGEAWYEIVLELLLLCIAICIGIISVPASWTICEGLLMFAHHLATLSPARLCSCLWEESGNTSARGKSSPYSHSFTYNFVIPWHFDFIGLDWDTVRRQMNALCLKIVSKSDIHLACD